MIFTLEICIYTYISASKYVDNETSLARGISPEKPSKQNVKQAPIPKHFIQKKQQNRTKNRH